MTFDECLKFLNNHPEELSTEMPSLGIIDIMIGTTFRQLRAKGITRRKVMQMILWGLFYFVQQETIFTDNDKQAIIDAIQATEANAYFVSSHREEEEDQN